MLIIVSRFIKLVFNQICHTKHDRKRTFLRSVYTYHIRNYSGGVVILEKSFVDERKLLMQFRFYRGVFKVPSRVDKYLDTIKLSIPLISPGLQFCCS